MTPSLERALSNFPTAELREARDEDETDLIGLVEAAYAEYPGCVLDLPGVDADLVSPASYAARAGTGLWVVADDGRVVGSVGVGAPTDDGRVELKRLYVAASHRRRGLAAGLVALVEQHAQDVNASTIDLWSDTRFTNAHRLYERLGYRPTGRTRDLHDPSNTTEYQFQRHLATA